MATDQDWQRTLVTWLHDPPDKALDVAHHELRARDYLRVALERDITPGEIKGLPDQIAAAFERLPLPIHSTERAPDRSNGIRSVHPLSGSAQRVFPNATIDSDAVNYAIRSIVNGLHTNQQRFLALWRLLPERLGSLSRLPAETRIADHTIIQHMDTTAGALNAEPGQIALLSFKLSPVQSFIEAARSTRDLLTGSYILSWLVFHAIMPLLEELGPTALIYPALRGSPYVDRWLRERHGMTAKIKAPDAELLTRPSLPNRFLAIVPYSSASALARQVEESCRRAWLDLAADVHGYLRQYWGSHTWDRLWQDQIDSFFNMQTAFVRQSECTFEQAEKRFADPEHKQWFQDMKALIDLREAIPRADRYNPSASAQENAPGQWQMALTFSAALMNCVTEIRHIPDYRVTGIVPGKCSLMGTYEQMGPAELSNSDQFWAANQSTSDEDEEVVAVTGIPDGRIKTGERLCAVSLVKRFAFEASLCRKLGIHLEDVRFKDTRKIAASGRATGLADPNYYAALMLDGDELGKWLDGRKSPVIRKIYDPKLVKYFEKFPQSARGLDARRPVGPALHAAISEALGNFSLHIAPAIVRYHGGTLIYAGGDDVLALLPVSAALACGLELRRAYSGSPEANNGAEAGFYRHGGTDLLTMGPTATASAGIAVAHYKEDMRLVLAAARRAERRAKNAGRNGLGLTIMRRSGEHSDSQCAWEGVEPLQNLVELNLKGASDRWAYHLRGQLDVLEALDRTAQEREIRRLLARSEGSVSISFDKLQGIWDAAYKPNPKNQSPPEAPLKNFTILCQSASFLARGRDDR